MVKKDRTSYRITGYKPIEDARTIEPVAGLFYEAVRRTGDEELILPVEKILGEASGKKYGKGSPIGLAIVGVEDNGREEAFPAIILLGNPLYKAYVDIFGGAPNYRISLFRRVVREMEKLVSEKGEEPPTRIGVWVLTDIIYVPSPVPDTSILVDSNHVLIYERFLGSPESNIRIGIYFPAEKETGRTEVELEFYDLKNNTSRLYTVVEDVSELLKLPIFTPVTVISLTPVFTLLEASDDMFADVLRGMNVDEESIQEFIRQFPRTFNLFRKLRKEIESIYGKAEEKGSRRKRRE